MPEEINAVEMQNENPGIGKLILGGLVLAGACIVIFGFGVPRMLKDKKEQEFVVVEGGPEAEAADQKVENN